MLAIDLRKRPSLAILAASALFVTSQATATTITLSSHSSDPAVDAALLDATLEFEVADGDTLTLTVSNDTRRFDIVAIYFNAPSSVLGLSLASGPKKWTLTSPAETQAFGNFDFAISVQGKDAKKDHFDAGDSAVFVFSIAGDGRFEASDFTTERSVTQPGAVAAFAAANFVGRSGGALGAFHTPEPVTAVLLGAGLLGLAVAAGRGKA